MKLNIKPSGLSYITGKYKLFEIELDKEDITVDQLKTIIYLNYKDKFDLIPCTYHINKNVMSRDYFFRFNSLKDYDIKDGDTLYLHRLLNLGCDKGYPTGYTAGICNCVYHGNNYDIETQKMLMKYCEFTPLEGFPVVEFTIHMMGYETLILYGTLGTTVLNLEQKIESIFGISFENQFTLDYRSYMYGVDDKNGVVKPLPVVLETKNDLYKYNCVYYNIPFKGNDKVYKLDLYIKQFKYGLSKYKLANKRIEPLYSLPTI